MDLQMEMCVCVCVCVCVYLWIELQCTLFACVTLCVLGGHHSDKIFYDGLCNFKLWSDMIQNTF